MFATLTRWLTADLARPAQRAARTCLGVESLEAREVLSGTPPGFALDGSSLFQVTATSRTLIDSNVKDVAVAGSRLVDLHSDGSLASRPLAAQGAGQWSVVASRVSAVIQSWDGRGNQVPILLHDGLFQQTNDGVNLSTIGLGGTITAIAEGRNAAGQQLLYALRADGALFEFAPSGLKVLEYGVQQLIQSWGGGGTPVPLLLQNGNIQVTTDGVNVQTIGLGGTITALADGRNASGVQVFYALRADGALYEFTPSGIRTLATGVTQLIQGWGGGGLPVPLFLQNGSLEQTTDGVTVTTIGLGGTITTLLDSRNSDGQQVFYALRADNTLFAFTPAGVNVVSWGVQSFTVAPDGTLYVLTTGGELARYAADGTKTVLDMLTTSFSLNGNQLLVNDWFTRNLPDAGVQGAARAAVINHGSITRADLLNAIFPAVVADKQVGALEAFSLRNLAAGGGTLGESAPTQYLLQQVANQANTGAAYWLQAAIDIQFKGLSHPTFQTNSTAIAYRSFPPGLPLGGYKLFGDAGPTYTDVRQGSLGDCTYLAAFAEVAYRQPQAIRSMFTDNGDGTFTVRFYVGNTHRPVFVTVDSQLPMDPNGNLIYAQVANGVLWPALLEKAYAQFNATGLAVTAGAAARGVNSYLALHGGSSWTSTNVLEAITNRTAFAAPSNVSGVDVYRAWAGGQLATLATGNADGAGLCHNHDYAVLSATPDGGLLLYNPWGQSGGNDRGDWCLEFVSLSAAQVKAYFVDWGWTGSTLDARSLAAAPVVVERTDVVPPANSRQEQKSAGADEGHEVEVERNGGMANRIAPPQTADPLAAPDAWADLGRRWAVFVG